LNTLWETAIGFSIEKIKSSIEILGEDFPDRCHGADWTPVSNERVSKHWVDGFWVGQLWLAYALTEDKVFEDAAREWADRVDWLKTTTETHDLGFIFYLSNVLGGYATGDESLFENALIASDTFTQRWNSRGEYLLAWGDIHGTPYQRGKINIDLMMNLSLMFWASDETEDAKYGRIAALHARTSRYALVRPDGSTAQVADFNPDTGGLIRPETLQGISHTSCWSRGQGWGLHGFAETYRRTGEDVFLYTARRLAEYMIANAPEDKVPFWDYDSLEIPNTYRDSSAAAVYAAGFMELADAEPDAVLAERWRAEAKAITQSLWENYATREEDMPCILKYAAHFVKVGNADHGLIYGDYYFLESLVRLAKPELFSRLFPRPVFTYGA
jgi:unsaturated chondroitin disaccharide hydrolase